MVDITNNSAMSGKEVISEKISMASKEVSGVDYESELAALQENFDDFIERSIKVEEELEAELDSTQAELSNSISTNNILCSKIQSLTGQISSLEVNLSRTKSDALSESKKRCAAEFAQEDAENQSRELEESLNMLKVECDGAHETICYYEADLEDLRVQLEYEKEKHRQEIEELRSDLASMVAKNDARQLEDLRVRLEEERERNRKEIQELRDGLAVALVRSNKREMKEMRTQLKEEREKGQEQVGKVEDNIVSFKSIENHEPHVKGLQFQLEMERERNLQEDELNCEAVIDMINSNAFIGDSNAAKDRKSHPMELNKRTECESFQLEGERSENDEGQTVKCLLDMLEGLTEDLSLSKSKIVELETNLERSEIRRGLVEKKMEELLSTPKDITLNSTYDEEKMEDLLSTPKDITLNFTHDEEKMEDLLSTPEDITLNSTYDEVDIELVYTESTPVKLISNESIHERKRKNSPCTDNNIEISYECTELKPVKLMCNKSIQERKRKNSPYTDNICDVAKRAYWCI